MTPVPPCVTRRHPSGVALLLVLWVVALLGIILLGLGAPLQEEALATMHRTHEIRATAFAEKGLAIGSYQAVKKGDPILVERDAENQLLYHVLLGSAESRIHLNHVLRRPETHPVLERLFVQWGLEIDQARSVIAALVDWIDPDDLPSSPTARSPVESLGYENRPPPLNRPFRNLDEPLLVLGFEQVTAVNPGWRDAFTLHGSGRLALADASADLIQAVLGTNEETAGRFLADRDGPDEIPGTFDDREFASLQEALSLLGGGQFAGVDPAALVVLQGRTRRIDSTGTFGRVQVTLSATLGSGATLLDFSRTRRILSPVEMEVSKTP